MTELSREQIKRIRKDHLNGAQRVGEVCDLALRAHDAEAERDNYRAKYREARQALADVRPEIDSLIAGLQHSHVNPSDGIVHDEDVAHEIAQLTELHERIVRLIGTATPEGEPEIIGIDPAKTGEDRSAPQTPEQTDDDALTAAYFAGLERGKGVPQQAHGDALAALDELQQFIVEGEEGQFDTIRKALTASGVPYVPDTVRRLVDEWRRREAHCREAAELSTGHRDYDAALLKGRADSAGDCAENLEAALAAAPAVCEWTYARTSLGRDGYKGACGADWWCEEGYGPAVISDVHPYCHGCGRRIQIAAAPTDGRE